MGMSAAEALEVVGGAEAAAELLEVEGIAVVLVLGVLAACFRSQAFRR